MLDRSDIVYDKRDFTIWEIDNVNTLFQMVYGITEFMEKPVNEW